MLKITRLKLHDHVRLKLEGKLSGEWVAEFRRVFDNEMEMASRPELDLSDVTFVDRAGAALLAKLRAEGTNIPTCSHFVSELLHGESK